MDHILDIDGEGYYLHIKNDCMIADKGSSHVMTVHPSDVLSVIFHGTSQTVSTAFLECCGENHIPVIICDRIHNPLAVMLPFNAHCKTTGRLDIQLQASEPNKKRIWQTIIKAKLCNQAAHLSFYGLDKEAFLIQHLAEIVKSGDSGCCEAQGARIYFVALFGKKFVRQSENITNILLNYIYTILRSCISREAAGYGLNPAFSVFHSNHENSFSLIDDLMEPFRPLADRYVKLILMKYPEEMDLTPAMKRYCIGITRHHVIFIGQEQNLQFALQNYIRSYVLTLQKTAKRLDIPEYAYDFSL
jgi:CRISP-associated protein Cas1